MIAPCNEAEDEQLCFVKMETEGGSLGTAGSKWTALSKDLQVLERKPEEEASVEHLRAEGSAHVGQPRIVTASPCLASGVLGLSHHNMEGIR